MNIYVILFFTSLVLFIAIKGIIDLFEKPKVTGRTHKEKKIDTGDPNQEIIEESSGKNEDWNR